jgi:tryptophanyl-tRNA synthetase
MARKLREGGYGWGHAKKDLAAALEAELGPKREKYRALRQNEAELDATLQMGASRARRIAHATMQRLRYAIGIDRVPASDLKTTLRLKT